jgi:hypothetical protein
MERQLSNLHIKHPDSEFWSIRLKGVRIISCAMNG